jgi:hypothetical protein
MAHKQVFALGLLIMASPLAASQTEVAPTFGAPPAGPEARYCLRVEPITGTRIGGIRCLTREEWADGDVDVDEVWARDGVRVV